MECVMDHIVLNIENDEKMIHFYTKVLLLTPERIEEYYAGKVPFPSVRMNTGTIIDLFPKDVATRYANWENKHQFKSLLHSVEETNLGGPFETTSGE